MISVMDLSKLFERVLVLDENNLIKSFSEKLGAELNINSSIIGYHTSTILDSCRLNLLLDYIGKENLQVIYNHDIKQFYWISIIDIVQNCCDINNGKLCIFNIIPSDLARCLYFDYITKVHKDKVTVPESPKKLIMNETQEMIVFMLMSNLTQQTIANMLNCSRSNIAKNIQILCQKFGISSTEEDLILFCKKNGFLKLIPSCILQDYPILSYSAA